MDKDKQRREANKPHAKLILGADGQYRPSDSVEHDIGDVWADQERIRREDLEEEEEKRRARQHIRKQKGLIGLAKSESSKLLTKTKAELLGEESLAKPRSKPPKPNKATENQVKTVEVRLTMPTLPRVDFRKRIAPLLAPIRAISRKKYVIVAGIVLVAGSILGYNFVFSHFKPKSLDNSSQSVNNGQTPKLVRGTPNYPTLLPTGKTIDELGGWTRVSPPTADPVYAYVDHIDGVEINVSQQPLPVNLKTDTNIANLAQNFGANQSLTAGNNTVYIGTSAKGPQSLIVSKNNTLILLKSTAIIPNNQWVAYINSLN